MLSPERACGLPFSAGLAPPIFYNGRLVFAKQLFANFPPGIATDDSGGQRYKGHDDTHNEAEIPAQDARQRSCIDTAENGNREAEQQPDSHTQAAAKRATVGLALRLWRQHTFRRGGGLFALGQLWFWLPRLSLNLLCIIYRVQLIFPRLHYIILRAVVLLPRI